MSELRRELVHLLLARLRTSTLAEVQLLAESCCKHPSLASRLSASWLKRGGPTFGGPSNQQQSESDIASDSNPDYRIPTVARTIGREDVPVVERSVVLNGWSDCGSANRDGDPDIVSREEGAHLYYRRRCFCDVRPRKKFMLCRSSSRRLALQPDRCRNRDAQTLSWLRRCRRGTRTHRCLPRVSFLTRDHGLHPSAC